MKKSLAYRLAFAGVIGALYAALSFFTLEGLEFMNCFTDGAREHGAYPLDVYGEGLLKFTTYVIPYALFQYFPLDRSWENTDNIGKKAIKLRR